MKLDIVSDLLAQCQMADSTSMAASPGEAGGAVDFPSDNAEPLTKAKLFASNDSGEWTEIGLGVVSVIQESVPSGASNGSIGGGKVGRAGERDGLNSTFVARLQMVSLESGSDLLLSSLVSVDDIYTVQGETILLWYDDGVGSEIACSFNNKEGCEYIFGLIKDYQRTERVRRLQSERIPTAMAVDRFVVQPRNLATILEAAESENKRFGIYVRDDAQYFTKLVHLFQASREKGDTETMATIARISLALLQPPFISDGKIISQFVENDRIDDCIDIVQYGIGRRDVATGFVSFEERRATFRNPCQLPAEMLSRIHVLYSCSFLKDLIPLSLDAVDPSSFSLFSTFTQRFIVDLMQDICRSATILPDAFQAAIDGVQLDSADAAVTAVEASKVAHLMELGGFVNEMSKVLKTGAYGFDMPTEIFSRLTQCGLLPFLSTVMTWGLRLYEPPADYDVSSWTVQPCRSIQQACDTLCHCIIRNPQCLQNLLAEATAAPQTCLLHLLLQAATVVKTAAEMESLMDVVEWCGVGASPISTLLRENPKDEVRRQEVLRFWIEGGSGAAPSPLLYVANHLTRLIEAPSAAAATTFPGVLQLSQVQELQLAYCLKVLCFIAKKVDKSSCDSFVDVFTKSKLLPALVSTLQSPQRRMANVQSSVISLIADVLSRQDSLLARLVTFEPSNLWLASMQLFLQCCHRDNILTASLGHLLVEVCDGVHRERLVAHGTSAARPSPFITILHGDDSIDKVCATDGSTEGSHLYEALASSLVEAHGAELKTAAPSLLERLQNALQETPEQAQQVEVETSSMASSMERSSLSNFTDFDTAAIDFGFEPQTHLPVADAFLDSRASLQSSSHSTSLSTASDHYDDDDDDEEENDSLADLSSIDSDNGDEEAVVRSAAKEIALHRPSLATAAVTAAETSSAESADLHNGHSSLLEDEENCVLGMTSVKRSRDDAENMINEEETEPKRLKSQEAAA